MNLQRASWVLVAPVVVLLIVAAISLLCGKSDVNSIGWGRRTALLKAADDGDASALKGQIAAGANLKAQNEWQDTALTLAAKGHPACVKILIAAHSDIEMRGWCGETPLIAAASVCDLSSLKTLLVAHALVNEKDELGDTALIKAAKGGFAICVKALLKAHADPDIRTLGFGNSALLSSIVSGNVDCTRALLSAKAQVNIRDADGNTPLIAATASGRTELVKLLVQYRADTEVKAWTKTTEPSNGFATPRFFGTALAYAAFAGRTDIVKVLLDGGAKCNPVALHAAAGHADLANLMNTAKNRSMPEFEHLDRAENNRQGFKSPSGR